MVIHFQDTCAAHTTMMRPIRFNYKTFLTVPQRTGDCSEKRKMKGKKMNEKWEPNGEWATIQMITDCLSAGLLQTLPVSSVVCPDSQPAPGAPFHCAAHETVAIHKLQFIRFAFSYLSLYQFSTVRMTNANANHVFSFFFFQKYAPSKVPSIDFARQRPISNLCRKSVSITFDGTRPMVVNTVCQ